MAATLPQKPVLYPEHTTILVTGANGFVASHIVAEALKLGYHVRGTARTPEKAEATKSLYKNNPQYTTAVVSDFATAKSEIAQAVKGVDSIIHVASDVTFSPDPNKVIPAVVEMTLQILRAAAKEPSVKRFTLTSSSVAVITQKAGSTPESTKTAESWNDESVELAWGKPDSNGNFPPDQALQVYSASKTEGERAFWKFIQEEKPHFVANAILPNLNFGQVYPGGQAGASGGAIPLIAENQEIPSFAPMHYINVTDTARLHLAAAVLDGSLSNQRIFAFAGEFNWNDVIDAIKQVRPDIKLTVEHDPSIGRDLTKVPYEQGAHLLKKWFGQDGYKSLAESVKENLIGVN